MKTETMKPITKGQIISIQTIISKSGLKAEKENIVNGITGQRTGSVAALSFAEAATLIELLNGKKQLNDNDKGQRMKRHIIAMAHEIGFVKEENRVMADGEIKPVKNYDDLHQWVAKYGHLNGKLKHLPAHQHLNKYPYKDLPKLVTQFKEMYLSKLKSKPSTK